MEEKRLDEIGLLWEVRQITLEEYINEIIKYKQTKEREHPGRPWDGNVPQRYSVTLDDGTNANVGTWVNDQRQKRKKRLRDGKEEIPMEEKRLDEIGLLWEVRQITLEEYINKIIKYKEEEERKHPGRPWDGNVPSGYSVTLDDGTKANVGKWVDRQKEKRKKRLRDGKKEIPMEEKRLDEIGLLWEVVTSRKITLEEYINEIIKYKEEKERKHPGRPWDGNVP